LFEKEGELFNHINAMYFDSKGYENYWQNRRKDKILKKLDKLKGECDSVLDVGSAEGLFVEESDKRGYFALGCDISRSKLIKAKGLRLIECDSQNLPYKNKSFDIVLLNRILELVPDEKETISEAIRVGKKYLIITVPNLYASPMDRVKYTVINLKKGDMRKVQYLWGVEARSYDPNYLKKTLEVYGKVLEMHCIAPTGSLIPFISTKIPIGVHQILDDSLEGKSIFRNIGHDLILILQINNINTEGGID
jgi:ubiquinone/menaquinone biosynthesis C-methylase UbiE